MSNFVQFKDRPEEFTKYLKDVKGVNIDGNSNLAKILLVLYMIGLVGLGGCITTTKTKEMTILKTSLDVGKAVLNTLFSNNFYQFGFGDYQFGIHSIIFLKLSKYSREKT